MPVPEVVDGIGEAAEQLERRFGLPRARFLADLWGADDTRWALVAERLAARAGVVPEQEVVCPANR